jgi:hypothetical protein
MIMAIAQEMALNPKFREHVEKKIEDKKASIYINEAHRRNSEAAMKHLAEQKNSQIDWEKEYERQRYNSKDHD